MIEEKRLENGHPYLEMINAAEDRIALQGAIRIDREVDRMYLHPTGSRSVVIWNPRQEKCAPMDDMEPDGYRSMVCIETANALDDARRPAPGAEHTLGVTISP
jgi:glucose-6-phosphate 1-epimerase